MRHGQGGSRLGKNVQGNDASRCPSTWATGAAWRRAGVLKKDVAIDVCVIGAGIAGMTVAYLLGRAGRSVAVLDRGRIAGGNTEQTTAHLSNAIDDRYVEIERIHGLEGAKLAAQSHSAAIQRIEDIAVEEQIACDFRRLDGYLFVPLGDSPEILERELESAHHAGLTGVERLARAPLADHETGPCLRFPDQGQFHPLKYIEGLARAIHRDGGSIHTGTSVSQIESGTISRVHTEAGPVVSALAVVVATNSPINDLFAVHTKQAPYLTYAIAARVPVGSVPPGLYWDTLDPYHYIRLAPGTARRRAGTRGKTTAHELLIVGGEDHKVGQSGDENAHHVRLESWAREHFPMIQEVESQWSGEVMESIDGLALIGRNPLDRDNVYIATGDSGMGMTHGTIAGMLLTDLILGRENPWAGLYDPARKPVGAVGDFASENLNVARQYGDWLTGGEVSDRESIRPGEGAILRRGLSKIAVYREDETEFHELTAVCPHLGCIVSWNNSDRTWDCPCHGSRFDRMGQVINAPANQDLKPITGD